MGLEPLVHRKNCRSSNRVVGHGQAAETKNECIKGGGVPRPIFSGPCSVGVEQRAQGTVTAFGLLAGACYPSVCEKTVANRFGQAVLVIDKLP